VERGGGEINTHGAEGKMKGKKRYLPLDCSGEVEGRKKKKGTPVLGASGILAQNKRRGGKEERSSWLPSLIRKRKRGGIVSIAVPGEEEGRHIRNKNKRRC